MLTKSTKLVKLLFCLEERDYTQILIPKDGWREERTTMSSLRLDSVISAVFNISRRRSKQLIESGKVKVNWTETTRPDFALDLLDIVSIRGFGRLQIQELEGKTKKEKISCPLRGIEKIISNFCLRKPFWLFIQTKLCIIKK